MGSEPILRPFAPSNPFARSHSLSSVCENIVACGWQPQSVVQLSFGDGEWEWRTRTEMPLRGDPSPSPADPFGFAQDKL